MDQFLEKVLSLLRIINCKLVMDDGEIIEEGIVEITRTFNSELLSTSMSYIEASIRGHKVFNDRSFTMYIGIKDSAEEYIYTQLEAYINANKGFSLEGATLSIVNDSLYINGNYAFKIDYDNGLRAYSVSEAEDYVYREFQTYYIDNDSIEYDNESDIISFTAYDSMAKFAKDYEPLEISYPVTVLDYAKAVCQKVGVSWSNDNESLVNGDQIIHEDLYANQSYTYRDVIREIAGVSGTIACIDFDNTLLFRKATQTNIRIEPTHLSLNEGAYHNDKFGPVNSIVLSMEPQEDNFFKKDDESIEVNGLCELKIANNQIMQDSREIYIEPIFNALSGLQYYPFEANSFGYCVFRPFDIVTLVDLEGNTRESIIFNSAITYNGSLSEVITTEIPESYVTDYSKATNEVKKLYRTILEVDKQKNQINAIVMDVDENKTNYTLLQQTSTGFSIRINSLEEFAQDTLTEEEIQQLIDEGIGSIKGIRTLTGTFDDNGLTFDRSTNQLQSNYSEDGIRITENGETVLVTDHTGNDAKNIRAREYLTVGNNSRFENYKDGTGCFFIGGGSN